MNEVIQEENHVEIINSYTAEDWKPMLDLIEEIEKAESFYTLDESVFDPYNYSPVVDKFTNLMYEIPLMINFNWGKWVEGKEIYAMRDFDFDSIDIPTKCKLLTALVRSERFNAGELAIAFDDGKILKILISIRNQLKT